ncbi:MAG TPA: GDSL-type esterase/lipase family protein [Candidatus Angelobacter sp.]|nr:GDSL-type esterase/lipase family protein [Candidatus Angelobacter sp.]
MKKLFLATLVAGASFILGSANASAQIRILPFGDSVTSFGSSPESSYRYWLFVDLTNAGFQFQQDFVFVGDKSGTEDGPPANNWPAEEYSGGGGQTAAEAAGEAPGIASQTQPDIVLMDFGSNDYDGSQSPKDTLAGVRTSLDAAIQAFAQNNPNTIILLARPTPWVTTDKGTKQFMSGLGGAVAKAAKDERKAGVNVIVVNIAGGFSRRRDTKDDGVHPNVPGEQKIANKYFRVLRKLI